MPFKVFVRVIITALIGVPILVLFLVTSLPNLYWQMVLKTLLPMTIAPFLIFGCAD
jgi:hypothetical protein